MFKIDLSGIGDMYDAFDILGATQFAAANKKIAKKCMKPVLDEIIATAPIDTQTNDGLHLRENIKLRVSGRTKKDFKDGNGIIARAEVYTKGDINFYAALIEFGRYDFVTERTQLFGKPTRLYKIKIGEIKPQRFMSNAMINNATAIVNTFVTDIGAELNKMIANRGKTAQKKINAKYKQAQKKANSP